MGTDSKPSIIAVITARQACTRLPNKALMDICGKPMLMRVVERVKLSCVDDVIVATSTNSPKIIELCKRNKVKCYAGSEEDQLARIAEAVPKCDYVVRVWGDSPLVDQQVISRLCLLCHELELDFMHNVGYPLGQHVWVARYDKLQELNETVNDYERGIFNEVDELCSWEKRYKHGILQNPINQSTINLSVDTLEDLERVRKIWERLDPLRKLIGIAS